QYASGRGGLLIAGESAARSPGGLIVIGDWRTRVGLADDLSREGFDVWAAGAGVGALNIYAAHTGEVDGLLLAAGLKDLPGPVFLTRFQRHFPGVPCVFLTGRSGNGADALEETGATVLPRSVEPAILADRLLEAVAFGAWTVES